MNNTTAAADRPADLGGPVEEATKSYLDMDFRVPVYPGIVAEYVNENVREGYLIQGVPGGYRFIGVDLPEFDADAEGNEIQLDADDIFGPVSPTIEHAAFEAINHLYENSNADENSWAWSKELHAKALPIIEANY